MYLRKATGNNVSSAEIILDDGRTFKADATSKLKPMDRPRAKSDGGFFQPVVDSLAKREMDSDAEYKVLSYLAEKLSTEKGEIRGSLHLYTELSPCESCEGVLQQFGLMFPGIRIAVSFDKRWGSGKLGT